MVRAAVYLAGAAIGSFVVAQAVSIAASPAAPRHRVGTLSLALDPAGQTLASLSPLSEPTFDFVPAARRGDGYVHISDIHLRLRDGRGPWRDFASAQARRPVRALSAGAQILARADITATTGDGFPLTIERAWAVDRGAPVMRFTLSNPGTRPAEVGALGLPMVFDDIVTGRDLEQAHARASFVDPYIGNDAVTSRSRG